MLPAVHALGLDDVASVASLVFAVTMLPEGAIALLLLLTLRLHFGHELPWQEAAWSRLFHAVRAFKNAGFAVHVERIAGHAKER